MGSFWKLEVVLSFKYTMYIGPVICSGAEWLLISFMDHVLIRAKYCVFVDSQSSSGSVEWLMSTNRMHVPPRTLFLSSNSQSLSLSFYLP